MTLDRARRISGWLAVGALAVVALTGAVLTWRYRPDAGGATWPDLTETVDSSRAWADWHRASLGLAALTLVPWTVLTAIDRPRRPILAMVAAAAAIGCLGLTSVAWTRVQWDFLGLWAVTVDSDVRGLWHAAFSDSVRFVHVEGYGELDPSDVRPWVVVHLIAPFVAVALVLVALRVTDARRPPRRTVQDLTEDRTVTELGR